MFLLFVRTRLVAAGAAALLLAAPLCATAAEGPQPATLSLTGAGEVSAKPDMAVINSGVVTEAKAARDALNANNAAMTEILAAFKRAGIAEKDLQTAGFSVEPQYYRPRPGKDGRVEPPRIIGYRVSNRLSIKVRDLSKVGGLLDLSVSLGANQVSGIAFTIDDDEPLVDEARKQAMADAIRKARLYADAAGVSLKRIMSIVESFSRRPPVPFAARLTAEAAAVPVAAGELSLTAEVNVTWEIE